jgi:membrane protein
MNLRAFPSLLKETAAEVVDDDVLSMSAAVAYYTVFSLPPLLVVVVALAGAVFGPEAVREALFGQTEGFAGAEAAAEIRTMIDSAGDVGESTGAKLAGIAALLFGASGAFGQMQVALNRAWEVEEKKGGGIVSVLVKRLLSFGMVLTIAFLLLVSLAMSAAIGAVGGALFGGAAPFLLEALNFVVSLAVSTLLFAALFVVLPDTDIRWRDVWVGAVFTAVLFAVGKTLIGLYVGQADPGSAFGAAGSLALVLLWIYYSSVIVLVGAEFTQVYTHRQGSRSDRPEARSTTDEKLPELPKPLPIRT